MIFKSTSPNLFFHIKKNEKEQPCMLCRWGHHLLMSMVFLLHLDQPKLWKQIIERCLQNVFENSSFERLHLTDRTLESTNYLDKETKRETKRKGN